MSTTSDLLRLISERPVAQNNEDSELDIVIEIDSKSSTKEAETETQTKNINLCLVIDRSGSMAGPKLITAKKCCQEIVKRLANSDLFSLVVFDNEAEVIVNPATPRDKVENKIDMITSGDATNLSLGWQLGVLESQTFMTETHINRLLVLSDGMANEGETKALHLGRLSAKAYELGITTSTIGIGDNFEEDLLIALAHESGGRFYSIQDSQLEDIINQEFKGSLATRIERPRITLELSQGLTVIEELNDLKPVGNKYRIRPIRDNDVYNFAVRVRITPEDCIDEQVSVEATLYDGEGVIQTKKLIVPLVSYEDFVQSDENVIVRSVVQQYKTTKAEDGIIKQLDDGNLDLMHSMIIEEIDGMMRVRDKLQEEKMTSNVIDETLSLLQSRELLCVDEKIEKSEDLLLLTDALNAIGYITEKDSSSANIRFFLQRLRKIMHYELGIHANRGHYARSSEEEVRHLHASYINIEQLIYNISSLVEELLERYPGNSELLGLKERFYERLERSE